MARRVLHRLKAIEVKRLPAGRHGDGGNLYLSVSPSGARSWLFLYRTGGRQPELGLGSVASVPLAAARETAARYRRALAEGIDPLTIHKRGLADMPTFGACADKLVDTMEAAWRNDKHRAQWRMTLREYAGPLRDRPVNAVSTEDVLKVLKPIWQTKPETASRVRGRIEAVLNAAKAEGFRSGDNPAAWRGHLDRLLPKRPKLSRGHHAAMPHADLPAFMGRLRAADFTAARALEFAILTAARTGETLGARWDEIDLKAKVWTVPAERMKAGIEHRVPLSGRVIAILEQALTARAGEFVFPGQKRGKPLSTMALEMTIRRMKVGVTVHGFRSTFRDWCGEATSFPREVAEAALAHRVGDETELAYRRGDALEKRRKLMEAWASFCGPTADKVAVLSAARKVA